MTTVTTTSLLAAAAVAATVLLSGAPAPRPRRREPTRGAPERPRWPTRGRPLWAGGAALGPVLLLPTGWSWAAGLALGALVWWLSGKPDSAAAAAAARVRAELPDLVLLVSLGLRAGQPAARALERAARAMPGVTADRLGPHLARLQWGVDPGDVWQALAGEPGFEPLGRALERSHRTGAAVADTVGRLAVELAAERRAVATDRAHRVGVRAAVPLGVCLLPAFLLLGIVPLAAGLLGSIVA